MSARSVWVSMVPLRRSEAVGVLTAQLTGVLTVGAVVDVVRHGSSDGVLAAGGVAVLAAFVVARLWADRCRFGDVDTDPFPLLTTRHPLAGFDPAWCAVFVVATVAVFHPRTTRRAIGCFEHPILARAAVAVAAVAVLVVAVV